MKLIMTTSLGEADGLRLGLPGAREGDEVTAKPEAANELINRGWAVEPGTALAPTLQVGDDRGARSGQDHPPVPPVAPPTVPASTQPTTTPAPTATPTHAASQVAEPDYDAMTKEELKAHADRQKVEGVTLAMNKDDMIKVLKKAARTR